MSSLFNVVRTSSQNYTPFDIYMYFVIGPHFMQIYIYTQNNTMKIDSTALRIPVIKGK